MLFHHLPKELIHYILSLEGSLKRRNGKWMNQLRTSEETRQKITSCISHKYYFCSNFSKMNYIFWRFQIPNTKNNNTKYISSYTFSNGKTHYSLYEKDEFGEIDEIWYYYI